MKIVIDQYGNYAIRRWSWEFLVYQYRDLKDDYWWNKEEDDFGSCLDKNIVFVEKEYNDLKYKQKNKKNIERDNNFKVAK